MPVYHPQGSLDSWAILIMCVYVIKTTRSFPWDAHAILPKTQKICLVRLFCMSNLRHRVFTLLKWRHPSKQICKLIKQETLGGYCLVNAECLHSKCQTCCTLWLVAED